MNTYLVTPASEAEEQLLAALFKKMRIKAQVLPAENGRAAAPRRAPKKAPVAPAPKEFIPQNQAEQNMLEAVLELKEVLAGRKQAQSLDEFWKEFYAE